MTESFKQRVQRVIYDLKHEKFHETLPRQLPIYDTEGEIMAFLTPVSHSSVDNKQHIRLLATWRNENVFAFPSQFKATEEGTQRWVKALVDNPVRILFFIQATDKAQSLVGHIGLFTFNFREYSCEIDNVVRGDKTVLKGVMTHALRTLTRWTIYTLGLKKIYLRVFDDNKHAINFYTRNEFIEVKRIPMQKKTQENMISWEPNEQLKHSDKYFIKMQLKS